jgi:type IX secretion system PorP/SprF family membrane protein
MMKKTRSISRLKNNQKFLLLVFAVLFITINIQAQQLPNYTQYLYNMQIINPAYVGVRADFSVSALSRQQWVGVEGAPVTNTFSVSGRTRRGLGIGATVVHDKIGLSETTNINVDASYTIITSQYSRLSFGLKGGISFFDNNFANALTPDNDIYASNSGRYPNVGFGAFYYNRDFYVGLSMPSILETPQFYIQNNFENGISENPSLFLSTGALFTITEDLLFKPSTMIRYTANVPVSIDFNTNFLYNEVIEAGLSYRYQNSVSALFAIIVNEKFRIGYAYDYKTMNVGENLSSHEIILHLDVDFKRNTRWLRSTKCYF